VEIVSKKNHYSKAVSLQLFLYLRFERILEGLHENLEPAGNDEVGPLLDLFLPSACVCRLRALRSSWRSSSKSRPSKPPASARRISERASRTVGPEA